MSRGEPLDPELRALFEVEARRGEPSVELREHVRAAVEAQVGGAPRGGNLADRAPVRPFVATWPVVLLGALAGAAIGVTTYSVVVPPEVRTVYVDRVVTAPPSSGPTRVEPDTSTTAETVENAEAVDTPVATLPSKGAKRRPPHASVSASTAASAPRVVASADSDLGADRSLLDAARTALTRGDGTGALSAVRRHREQFPRSQLGEEREVIGVQALMTLGRRDEARIRASEFAQQHPQSPFLSVLQAISGGEP